MVKLVAILILALCLSAIEALAESGFERINVADGAAGVSSVYAVDIDGDADLDVLSASSGDSTIAWYENDGNESFTKKIISDSARGAAHVYALDLDGDSDVDVLSASSSDDTIAWYENNGNQYFTKRIISDSVDGANAVYALDLDGDSDVDVLSASSSDDTIAWYENDGSQSFTKRVVSTSADSARSVFALDLDGDSDIDIFSASYSDDKLAWYENDGSQSFTERIITSTADGARSVYALDVDGDTDIDVLCASSQDNTIAWYENDGSQSFTKRVVSSSATGAQSVHGMDIDSDGDIDVVSALDVSSYNGGNGHTIAWYENDGSEVFTQHTLTTIAWWARYALAVDLDGDSDVDVLSASAWDSTVAWYDNDGSETFTKKQITTGEGAAYAVYAIDVDGDSDVDIVSGSFLGQEVVWFENIGNDQFTRWVIATGIRGVKSVFALDLDGDTDVDVLSASHNDDLIAWYENDGSEGFTQHVISNTANSGYSVFALDVDGDDDIDVLSASYYDDKIAWYENDGDESFTERIITTSADGASSVFALDLDGDTDIDVLSASSGDDTIAWYENDGSEGFTPRVITNTADGARSVYASDFNGDGYVDVLSASYSGHTIDWYENDGSQSFTRRVVVDNYFGASAVHAVDMDGDADIDIVGSAAPGGRIDWYENDGGGHFTQHIVDDNVRYSFSVYAIDVNGDTHMDILGATYFGSDVIWYKYDTVVPEVLSITRLDSSPTNAQGVRFLVEFSEPVSDFTEEDLSIVADGFVGSSVSDIMLVGDAAYHVTVATGVGDGPLSLSLDDDDSVVDSAAYPLGGAGVGNGSYDSGEAYQVDTQRPLASIVSDENGMTSTERIPIHIGFDEDVTGLAIGEFNVTGATLENLTASNDSYSIDLLPSGAGVVSLNFIENAAQDTFGNLSLQTSPYVLDLDLLAKGPIVGTSPHVLGITRQSLTGVGLPLVFTGYSKLTKTSTYVGTGAGQNWRANDAWWTYEFPSGSSFPFYGINYERMFVSSNGRVCFGSGSEVSSGSITDTACGAYVAPLWGDLDTSDGDVLVRTEDHSHTVIWDGDYWYDQALAGVLDPGTPQNWNADDQAWDYPLPFSFPFYGDNYNTVYVNSNGQLCFGSSSNNWGYGNSLNSTACGPFIAPLWQDLRTDGAGEDIFISEGNGQVAIQWRAEDYSEGNPITFEVVLSESGAVRFNYGAQVATQFNDVVNVGVSKGDGVTFTASKHHLAQTFDSADSVLFIYNAQTGAYDESTVTERRSTALGISLRLEQDGSIEFSYRDGANLAAMSSLPVVGIAKGDGVLYQEVAITDAAQTIDNLLTYIFEPNRAGKISGVNYQLDTTSGAWHPCSPLDGAFNEQAEEFTCSWDFPGSGSHRVYLRATDSFGITSQPAHYQKLDFNIPLSTVSGTVEQNGVPIGGATVKIEMGGSTQTTTTNEQGVYSFSDVADGHGVIKIEKGNTSLAEAEIDVAIGQSLELETEVGNSTIEPSPAVLWNGFLGIVNILELVNPTDRDLSLELLLHDLNGHILSSTDIILSAESQRDVIVNDLGGFQIGVYGVVSINSNGHSVDGRAMYYRPEDGASWKGQEFAFVIPLHNAHEGASYAVFNSFNPSNVSASRDVLIPNWLSIANVGDAQESFDITYFAQSGDEIATTRVVIPSFGRRDVQAGHEFSTSNSVGLVRIQPVSSTANYISSVTRYGVRAALESFGFGFGVPSRGGNGSTMVLPVGVVNGLDVVELANVSGDINDVNLSWFDQTGTELATETIRLNAFAQKHLLTSSVIPEGHTGSVMIDGSGPVIAGSATYYYDSPLNEILTATYIEAHEAFGSELSGSFNAYFDTTNWLRLINLSATGQTFSVECGSETMSLSLEAKARRDLPFCAADGATASRYGPISVMADTAGTLAASIVRSCRIGSKVDFMTAMPVQ